jgi:hypothetical protein
MTNAELAKLFSASNWLANLGEADESATVLLQQDYGYVGDFPNGRWIIL